MKQERPMTVELDPSLVRDYAATFIPRTDLYPIQLPGGQYVSVKKTLSATLVEAHLKGSITLGAYALDRESRAKWICFDADDDEGWHKLLDMAWALDLQSVHPYLERSRRGGHIWLFTPPLPGVEARRFGKQLAQNFGLADLELFPKQDVLRTGPGSFVRLPLGKHQITGKRYHFVTLDGRPLAPTVRAQVQALASPQLVPQWFIDETLARAPETTALAPTPDFRPTGEGEVETLSERLKSQISVYDFVRQYVELDSRGRGHCPFHEDEHKSFGVNLERNFWGCFAGCGGGSLVDFWMKWREKQGEDPSFTATLTELAEMLL